MNHPSLSGPFRPPPPLMPQPTMNPYVPCWCGSGKKWKWCHKVRAKQPPIDFHKLINKMRRELSKGYCSHPDASSDSCSERIIQAHTVQRRGGLAAIAENGHVISTTSAARDMFKNKGKFVPREVGIRGVSTFAGFCNYHDTEMFRPIESQFERHTAETCFLLSFRAISYEYFLKQWQVRLADIWREMDCGMPFERQAQIQSIVQMMREGSLRGLSDGKRWKEKYDTLFRERCFDEHRFVLVEFSHVLPIVGCGAFHPEYDFEGKPLQIVSRGTQPHEHITCNLSVIGEKSVMVMGLTEKTNGPAEAFMTSFLQMHDRDRANAIVRLVFEHIENIYLRPSWWINLGEETRGALTNRMRSGVIEVERKPECLKDDGRDYMVGIEITGVKKTQ